MENTNAPESVTVGRRRLLRGSAVAGLAGVGAAALGASPANAATNDPVVLGATNYSNYDVTKLNSASADAPTLELSNPNGATLRLNAPNSHQGNNSSLGSIALSPAGDVNLYAPAGSKHGGWVYSDVRAVTTVAVPPTRFLDTRTSAGRSRIIDVQGAGIDFASGRVRGGTFVVIHLAGLVEDALGIRANFTVAKTARSGFMTVWGRGDIPDASSLNWWAGGQILSNTVMSYVGGYTLPSHSYSDVIALWITATAAVIADASAFIVGSPWQVDPSLGGLSASGATAAGAAAGKRARPSTRPSAGAASKWTGPDRQLKVPGRS